MVARKASCGMRPISKHQEETEYLPLIEGQIQRIQQFLETEKPAEASSATGQSRDIPISIERVRSAIIEPFLLTQEAPCKERIPLECQLESLTKKSSKDLTEKIDLMLQYYNQVTHKVLTEKDASNAHLANTITAEFMRKKIASEFDKDHNKALIETLKKFVDIMQALHEQAHRYLYARTEQGPRVFTPQEIDAIIHSLTALHSEALKQCLALYKTSPNQLTHYVNTELAARVKTCIQKKDAPKLTAALLAHLEKQPAGAAAGAADDASSVSSLPVSVIEVGDKVFIKNRFATISSGQYEDQIIMDKTMGECLIFPAKLQEKLPAIPVYQLIINKQNQETCAYQMMFNAKAIDELIEQGKKISSTAIRHQEQPSASECSYAIANKKEWVHPTAIKQQ
jgi:hypothetical protein